MDRKLSEKERIGQLIRQSQAARSCLGKDIAALKRRFDIPKRLKGSLTAHPGTWMLGSMTSGLLASVFLRRRPHKISIKRKGALAGLAALALTAVKPIAKVWLANLLREWIMHSRPSTTAATRRFPGSQLF
jgi:hypothetical protein